MTNKNVAAAALRGISGFSIFSKHAKGPCVSNMYLKFSIIPSVLFIFTEIHMQTQIPKYETYKTKF